MKLSWKWLGERLGLDNDDYRRIRAGRDFLLKLAAMPEAQRAAVLQGLPVATLARLLIAVQAEIQRQHRDIHGDRPHIDEPDDTHS